MKPVPFYDDSSYDYKKYWQERKYEDEADRMALKKLLRFIPHPHQKIILDLGCGFGRLTPLYAPLFKKCLLIDPSQRLLKEAKKLKKKYPHLDFKKAFAEKLPLKNKRVEVILFIRACHHLQSLQPVVKELSRVLKPGGFLILEFANKIHIKSVIRAVFKKKLNYLLSHLPESISTDKEVPFFNYHPTHVKSLLLANDFKIIKGLSVSNFRNRLFKKIFPLKLLLWLENLAQEVLASFSFGPSIFLFCQKGQKT